MSWGVSLKVSKIVVIILIIIMLADVKLFYIYQYFAYNI